MNQASNDPPKSSDLGGPNDCPEYILKEANILRGSFLEQASKEIAAVGHKSFYKDPDELRRFYYANYFYDPICKMILKDRIAGPKDILSWVRYSGSIQTEMLNELEERVNHLRLAPSPNV